MRSILVAISCCLLLTSCATPVTSAFHAKAWEKCFVAAQNEIRRNHEKAALPLLMESAKQARSFPPDDVRRTNTEVALGFAQLHAGMISDAAKTFKEPIDNAKGVMRARALEGLAECRFAERNYEEALALFRQSTQEFELAKLDSKHGYDIEGRDYANALVGMSDCLLSLDKPAEVVTPLRQAAKVSESTIALVPWKANIQHKYLSTMFGLSTLREVTDRYKMNSAWAFPTDKADHALRKGDPEEALQLAHEAETYLMGSPNEDIMRPITDFQLAEASYGANDFDAALKYSADGIALRASLPTAKYDGYLSDLYNLHGLASESKGNLRQARDDLQKAIAISEFGIKKHPLMKATFLAQLATIEAKLGNRDQAQKLVDEIPDYLDRHPRQGAGKAILNYWLARYYATVGDTENSNRYAELSVEKLQQARPEHYLLDRLRAKNF